MPLSAAGFLALSEGFSVPKYHCLRELVLSQFTIAGKARIMSLRIQVIGQVVSGRGIGKHEVVRCSAELHGIVKKSLYPGTLNVLLNRPLRLLETAGFTFDRENKMVWPAALSGEDVWIYRWRGCPLHVVGVLSSICLRERFNLKDGDDVTLGVSNGQIGAINTLGRLAWAALWIGRRNSFFLRDTCHTGLNRTMIWSKKLGALQQQPEVKGAPQLVFLAANKIIREMPAVDALVRSLRSMRGEHFPPFTGVSAQTAKATAGTSPDNVSLSLPPHGSGYTGN